MAAVTESGVAVGRSAGTKGAGSGRRWERGACVLLLVALVWLGWQRWFAAGPVGVVPTDPQVLLQQAAAVPVRSVEEIAAAFPEPEVAAVLARVGAGPATAVEVGQALPSPAPGAADAPPRSHLNPVILFKITPLAVTGERLIRNSLLNPRDAPFSRHDAETLAALLDIYRGQIETAINELGQVRQREMLRRIAAGELPTIESLGLQLSEVDRTRIARELERSPELTAAEAGVRRRSLEISALMRRLGPDAYTGTPDGQVYVASRGLLRAALADHQAYCDFLQEEFFARTIGMFCGLGMLTQAEAGALLRAYSDYSSGR